MGQTSTDINQQEGWTQSETTQYQRAPPAVSSRQQGLLCGKHGRQEALWSSPIRQEESESEKVTACLRLTSDSQCRQTELISESGRQHEPTSEDTGRQPESRLADHNSRPESSVKDAFQQPKADFIETARRQDLTSSYLCRQQKSKLGVNNPVVIEDPVHRQAVSKCQNQPVEGLISGQAEGSRMVRKTEQTGSTVTYNLRNRQRVFPVLAGYTSDKLRTLQEADPDIQPILTAKTENKRPSSSDMVTRSPAARHYWVLWESTELENGVLYKRHVKQDGTAEYMQLIVPLSLRREVYYQMHDSSIGGGHMGGKKTREKTQQNFYWYKMKEDINSYVSSCDTCAQSKKPNKMPRAHLGSLEVGAPMDRLNTDFVGPLPKTPRGNRYILVVSDQFSKWAEFLPVPDQTARVCAKSIFDEVICKWGCPLSIHSDQGGAYESDLFKELCQLLEVRKTRSSVRRPQGNGQVERLNRSLLGMIRAYLCGEQTDWDIHLPCLAFAYRSSPHEASGMTANLLMTGREARLPAELAFHSQTRQGESVTSYGEYVEKLKDKIQHAHEIARKHLQVASRRNKGLYDVKVAVNKYDKGDIVWMLNEARHLGTCPKLEMVYEGPYLIKQKVSEMNYVIQLDEGGKQKLVHHNKLKPYRGENPPRWILRVRRKARR